MSKLFVNRMIAFLLCMILLCSSNMVWGASDDTLAEENLTCSQSYFEVIGEIEPQYEEVTYFSEGMAAVKKDGKWGYINASNEVVIPFMYDHACIFSEGYALVAEIGDVVNLDSTGSYKVTEYDKYLYYVIDINNNKYKLIAEDLSKQLSESYSESFDVQAYSDSPINSYYYNNYMLLEKGVFWEYTLLFTKPKQDGVIYSLSYLYERYELEGQERPEDPLWSPTPPVIFTNVYDGLFVGNVRHTNTNGYFSSDLKMVLNKYEIAEINNIETDESHVFNLLPFHKGVALVGVYNSDLKKELYGFIDKTGKFIIEPQYLSVMYQMSDWRIFREGGYAIVQNQDEKWGTIDINNNIIVPFIYDQINPGELLAVQKDGKYGFIDKNNNLVIDYKYDLATEFNGVYAVVVLDGNGFVIDRYGRKIQGTENLPLETYFKNDEVWTFGNVVITENNGLYGFKFISCIEKDYIRSNIENTIQITKEDLSEFDNETLSITAIRLQDIISDNNISVDNLNQLNNLFNSNQHQIYDIDLKNIANQNDNYIVRMAIPDNFDPSDCKIVRINDDGSIEYLEYTIIDNYIYFVTEHFSYYAVIELKNVPDLEDNKKDNVPKLPHINKDDEKANNVTDKSRKIVVPVINHNSVLHNIHFRVNGGSTVFQRQVVHGDLLTEPAEPIRKNHEFIGWYEDEELTKVYDFNKPVQFSFTLYAKWNLIND